MNIQIIHVGDNPTKPVTPADLIGQFKEEILTLETYLEDQHISSWKYAGQDYQNEIMAAEDSLDCLLGRDSIRTVEQALQVARTL